MVADDSSALKKAKADPVEELDDEDEPEVEGEGDCESACTSHATSAPVVTIETTELSATVCSWLNGCREAQLTRVHARCRARSVMFRTQSACHLS